jgi:transposase
MPFLVTKKDKHGNEYLYIRHNHRVNGKSAMAYQVYLGPKKDFKNHAKIVSFQYETETFEFGLVAALLKVARKIGLVDLIDRATSKRNQGLGVGDHLFIAALNRCVEPRSKAGIQEWLKSTILGKVYPDLDVNVDSRAYWNHFQYLDDESIETIENKLMQVIKKEYGVDFTHLSFDPTNFYTYINPRKENQELPRHGHSKEGRVTLNLVNLSLFLAIDGGIPLFHLTYPGNVVDSVHFKPALNSLQERLAALEMAPGSVTLTFDKGNLSPGGFKLIDNMDLGYVCSDRPSSHKDKQAIPPGEFEMHVLPNGKTIGVKEFRATKYGKSRRFIAVYNPKEAGWNLANLKKKVQKKVDKIDEYFATRTNFAPGEKKRGQADKWRNKAEVQAKIDDLVGKEPFASIIAVTIEGPDKLPIATGGYLKVSATIVDDAIESTSYTHGKSFLMTSREDLNAHEVVWVYRQQYLVEQAFKWLKSKDFLSIRPMWHHVDTSIRGHVFTCYLGLVLLSLLVRELTQLGVSIGIQDTISHLNSIKMTRIHVDGREEPIESIDKMSPEAKKIYDLLSLAAFA